MHRSHGHRKNNTRRTSRYSGWNIQNKARCTPTRQMRNSDLADAVRDAWEQEQARIREDDQKMLALVDQKFLSDADCDFLRNYWEERRTRAA